VRVRVRVCVRAYMYLCVRLRACCVCTRLVTRTMPQTHTSVPVTHANTSITAIDEPGDKRNESRLTRPRHVAPPLLPSQERPPKSWRCNHS